jgi:hypothetical protein
MLVTLLLIGLGTLSILLGFIALLSQKIYLHPETKELTEVEVPILGRPSRSSGWWKAVLSLKNRR